MKLMKATLRRLWRLTGATSIAVSLAVVVALAGGVVSQAVAAPSGTTTAVALLKGVSNTANTVTTLVNSGTGEALILEAIKLDPEQPALRLKVPANRTPLMVNPEAGKAINLTADKLDGKEATEFLGAREKALEAVKADEATKALKADEAAQAVNSEKLGGVVAMDYMLKEAKALDSFKADEAKHAANADNAANAEKLGGVVAMDYMLKEAKALDSFKADEAKHAANADNAANAANSDKLDGKDSTDFTPKTYFVTAPPPVIVPPAAGTHPLVISCDDGDIALSGGWSFTAPTSTLQVMGSDNVELPPNQWRIMINRDVAVETSSDEVRLSVTCADYGAPHQQ
jgi:hypothetical protein